MCVLILLHGNIIDTGCAVAFHILFSLLSLSRNINYTWFVQSLRYNLTRHGIVESNTHYILLEANTLTISFLCTCYVDIVIVSWKYSFLLIARKKNKQQAPMGNIVFRSDRCWSVARQHFPTLPIDTLFSVAIYFPVHMNYFIYCLHTHFGHY